MKVEAVDLFFIVVSLFLHTSSDVPARQETIYFTNIKTCEYVLQLIDDKIKLAEKAYPIIQKEGRFEIEEKCEYYPDNGRAKGDKRRDIGF